ncbi:MetQ/NlpA family ABC transporter substrate-binding protein [Nakamurella sp. A5-74]|uniref:MetQ/NlpA family ABC transporter substrate-binding protein n=1 Tax=Nakamurella sp. A5-74 TaxID=3158264 RepID=A0AAU8DQA3_9ACTN
MSETPVPPSDTNDRNDAADVALPQRPGRAGNRTVWFAGALVIVIAIAATLFFTLRKTDSAASGSTVVRIGTTEESADYWAPLKAAAARENIDIQLVNFSDYTQANPALAQKQVDLNLFQHLLYLANYDVADSQTLVPIGSTVVVPLSLYSKKHTSLDQIPRGGKIAIPNDATNQARALLVLQQAGLISLKGGGSVLSTPAEIDPAESKVTVTPVDAAQTVASLPSVDGAIINNNFVLDAKIDPTSALYSDDPSKPAAEPYINAFVARSEDKDNPTYLRIVELYHQSAVIDAVKAQSKNTAIIVQRPASELQGILTQLEGTVKEAG